MKNPQVRTGVYECVCVCRFPLKASERRGWVKSEAVWRRQTPLTIGCRWADRWRCQSKRTLTLLSIVTGSQMIEISTGIITSCNFHLSWINNTPPPHPTSLPPLPLPSTVLAHCGGLRGCVICPWLHLAGAVIVDCWSVNQCDAARGRDLIWCQKLFRDVWRLYVRILVYLAHLARTFERSIQYSNTRQ